MKLILEYNIQTKLILELIKTTYIAMTSNVCTHVICGLLSHAKEFLLSI